jgi:outer membrane protein insertion porin family
MKNKLRILASLLFFFFTTQPFSSPINKINFIGLNNAPEESLLQLIPLKAGQEYTNALSNGIIESLFETGLFSDISISNNENSLNITLKENPTIKHFDINVESASGFTSWLSGEKILMTKDLLDEELTNNMLSAGNPYTQRKLNNFILMLESKYAESGYYNAKISPNVAIDAQNRAGIDLNIQQGDRVKIASFKISGAEKLSEASLLKLFKIGEADMLIMNYFTNKDLFTEAEFKKGIDLMTNTYFDSGYLDFQILNIDSELDDSKEKISIDINISEGIQYQLGKITFQGETEVIGIEVIKNAISMNEGDIFNRNLVIKDIQILTDMFADKGYAL